MKLTERFLSRRILFDFAIIALFSGLICAYTALLVYRNAQERAGFSQTAGPVQFFLGSPLVMVGVALLFAMLCLVGWLFLSNRSTVFSFLYKHKVLLTILVVVIWLLFGLNNTSLYQWSHYLGGSKDYAPLWGLSREVRSDEWAVWSTFVFAQNSEGYPTINSLISGGNIDTAWISVGGIPAWSAAAIFKPFYWGFLLFGVEFGFSFLSICRFVLLFWISFAFAKVYTKNNRILSFTAAITLTLSPYIQWWYSQSIAEVFIFGQGMLLAGYHYVTAQKTSIKILCTCLFGYLLGCYIMIAYPSWLIGFFYLVIALSIWGLVHYRKHIIWRKDIYAILPALFALGLIVYNVWLTKDTLLSVSNSVYPGARLHTGKVITPDFYTGLFSFLFPLRDIRPFGNLCESANFLSFSPAGLVFAIYGLVKKKGKDSVTLTLIGLEAALVLFMLVGVSPIVAQITFLSQCTRLLPVIAMIDMILLYRNLADAHIRFSPVWALVLTVASALLAWLPGITRFGYSKVLSLGLFVLGLCVFFLIYRCSITKGRSVRRMCFALICCAVLAGAFVNPIQMGVSCITELDIVKQLQNIDDDAVFLVEGDFPYTNIPLLAGKKSFNSTSVYPSPEKWSVLDGGENWDVYNRFFHTDVELCIEETSFDLIQADRIKVSLCWQDLRRLNIEYLITACDYEDKQFEDMKLLLKGSSNGFNIYHIVYK